MSDHFDGCISRGGQVRTETLSDTEYRTTCTIDGNVYYGEMRTKLTKQQKRRNALRKKRGNKRSST